MNCCLLPILWSILCNGYTSYIFQLLRFSTHFHLLSRITLLYAQFFFITFYFQHNGGVILFIQLKLLSAVSDFFLFIHFFFLARILLNIVSWSWYGQLCAYKISFGDSMHRLADRIYMSFCDNFILYGVMNAYVWVCVCVFLLLLKMLIVIDKKIMRYKHIPISCSIYSTNLFYRCKYSKLVYKKSYIWIYGIFLHTKDHFCFENMFRFYYLLAN